MDKVCGIIKSNKHSYYDFGLKIISREFNPPSKKKVKETLPYMNGSYDFSSLYGDNVYEERTIKYVFDFRYKNKIDFINKKIAITNWLTSNSKEPLYDDLIPGYYFIAECEDSIKFSEGYIDCEVTVVFVAYPFKISTLQDGHDIWDEFNFELDMVQDTKFEVEIIKNIQLYNNGAAGINPIVTCSNDMDVIKGNTTFKFKIGESKSWSFKLDKGLNNLTIKGTGTIEFKWYKEVL